MSLQFCVELPPCHLGPGVPGGLPTVNAIRTPYLGWETRRIGPLFRDPHDSSRIARDIPDAIRVMQQLKFLGIRVIYISQGIDSEQADALVAVHSPIDSLYLKELAKGRGFCRSHPLNNLQSAMVATADGNRTTSGRPRV